MKPTTNRIKSKLYRCKRCGHERQIQTNHYGECYSLGHYNACPACPPWAKYSEFGGLTVWVCTEKCPEDMAVPEPWTAAKISIK